MECMRSNRDARSKSGTAREHRARTLGGVDPNGSLGVTVAVVAGLHATLAAVAYPAVTATLVGTLLAGVALGAGLTRLAKSDPTNRQVCVPGTETCVEV